jgi:hypothetical protein
MSKSNQAVGTSKGHAKAENKHGAVQDPVADLQRIEVETRGDAPLDDASRSERRSLLHRTSPTQINLVLSFAQQSGGLLGGIAIDAETIRNQQSESALLRVGAAVARRLAQRLNDRALVLESTIARKTLSAIGGLEAQSKTDEGSALAPTVAELRAAARRRKSSGSTKGKGAPPTTVAPAPTPVATTGATHTT